MTEITKLNSGGYYEILHNYSRLVMVDNWIFMANSAGVVPATGQLADGPVEQAMQTLTNIEHTLAQVGSDMSDIVRLVISIPRREDIMPIQGYIGGRFKGIDPVMTLTCTPLGSDDYRVEIEATAYKGAGKQTAHRINSGLFTA